MNQADFYQAKLNFETDSWDLFEDLRMKKDVVVVDARSSEAFDLERIPTSINIPHQTMSDLTTSHLSKTKTYVTYCEGIGCNASTKGALKLTQLGFKTKELLGGLDWWKRDGYATEGENGHPGETIEE